MHKVQMVAALLALVAGCGGGGSDSESADLESGANTDVQVISAKSKNGMFFGMDNRFDVFKCHFFDKKDAHSPTGEFTSVAKADCTDMVANGLEAPLLNQYIEPEAAIREDPELKHAIFTHSCTEVEVVVAVKAAAWDSPSFEGIGFYGRDKTLNLSADRQRTFYKKTDARLVRIGEGRLKSENEKVYLYRFGGAGPCANNGSGNPPSGSVEFKPYVTYEGGFERWEAVAENHQIEFRKEWDRSDDLLQ